MKLSLGVGPAQPEFTPVDIEGFSVAEAGTGRRIGSGGQKIEC